MWGFLHWFPQTWSVCFNISEVAYLCMMDRIRRSLWSYCRRHLPLAFSMAGKQGGLHWCSVLHCSRSESLVSALGWARAGWSWFWTEIPQLSSAIKRGRMLTQSSPGGKDLTWTLHSRCCGFVCIHPCILCTKKVQEVASSDPQNLLSAGALWN